MLAARKEESTESGGKLTEKLTFHEVEYSFLIIELQEIAHIGLSKPIGHGY